MPTHNIAKYFRRWNFKRHTPIDPLITEQARRRNAKPDVYSVALFESDSQKIPTAVLEVDWPNDFAGVWFFDDQGRRTLNYAFRRQADKLFLFNMIHYAYPKESSRMLGDAVRTEEFTFQPSGEVRLVITNDSQQQKITEDRRDVDVSNHWEPMPTFGKWDSLARWDRSK